MEDLTKSDESEFADEVFSLPPVRIAVVAHKENDWFQESVASFANLNYSDKQLIVLATGQTEWVEPIVSQHFPDADILEVDPEAGLGANFNQVLNSSDEPAFYLFCHHDVALAPDALRLMVEESYRSNAAVVGPKVVNWERPNELLDVGKGMNRFAVTVQRVEAGEIDQEQFDSVEQVFAVSNTAFLVRSDLFKALGGFDEAMGMFGEDLDFCWRAQIAGGTIMIVPGAVARHRDESGEYQTNPKRSRLMERHRLRSILSNYGKVKVLPMLLLNLLISTVKGILGLLRGRLSNLLILADSFIWNLLNTKSLIQKRKRISELRRVKDSEVTALKINPSHTQRAFPSLDIDPNAKRGSNGRLYTWINELRNGPSKVSVAFSLLAIALFLFGSRHLLTRKVPAVGELVPFDSGPKEIFELWASGYWASGLGYEGAMPNAVSIIGFLGIIFLGFMGLLRTVLTLGMIPIGVLGIWFFLKPFGSPYIKVSGALIYLVSPVSYYALSVGNWDALILYGSLPWALIMIGRAGESSPFGESGGKIGSNAIGSDFFREALTLGVLVGVIVSLSPVSVLWFIAVAILVLMGSLIAGTAVKVGRFAMIISLSCFIALALNLPWLLDGFIYNPSLETILGNRTSNSEAISVAKALTLNPDLAGNSILGWGFPAVAAVPLLIARGERWGWAVRGWAFYLAGVGLVWIETMKYLSFPLPQAEILLIPGSLGLAIAGAMGAGALQRDLQTFKFGWRQMVPVTAIVAMAMIILPFLSLTFSGDWGMPDDELNDVLVYEEDANSKVLWISDSDLLPEPGEKFTDELSIIVTTGLTSSFENRWQPPKTNVNDLLKESLELARDNGTSNLGILLAQFGITDIILLERLVPLPSTSPSFQIEERFKLSLSRQLDLLKINIAPGITRYENLSSVGFGAIAAEGSTVMRGVSNYASASESPFIEGLQPVSVDRRHYQGVIATDQEVYVSFPFSKQWKLEVDSVAIEPEIALDWATGFSPSSNGTIDLRYSTSSTQKATVALQIILWFLAIVALTRALSDVKVDGR